MSLLANTTSCGAAKSGRVLALVAGAILLAACGGATHTAASTVTHTVTAQPALPQAAGQQPPSPRAPKIVIDDYGNAQTVIDGDGRYVVYTDIMPGRYRNAGGTMCYWARLRSLDPSDVIESQQSSAPQNIGVEEGDTALLTRNCGAWQLMHVPSPWEF